jgi:hypothetical protein
VSGATFIVLFYSCKLTKKKFLCADNHSVKTTTHFVDYVLIFVVDFTPPHIFFVRYQSGIMGEEIFVEYLANAQKEVYFYTVGVEFFVKITAVAVHLAGKPCHAAPLLFERLFNNLPYGYGVFRHKKSVNRLWNTYFTPVVQPKTVIANKRKQFTPRGREPPQLILLLLKVWLISGVRIRTMSSKSIW